MAKYTKQIQEWLFASEGGYVNHPKDPGGETNHGITKRTLAAWRGTTVRGLHKSAVLNLTRAEAAQIMKRNYWDVIHGDDLPAGLAYALYDYAVNSGQGRAVKDLQRILKVKVDGSIGSITMAAIAKFDVVDLIKKLCQARFAFVKRLKTFKTFGKGWTLRIMGKQIGSQINDIGVIDRAVMLAENVKDIPAPVVVAQGKAEPEKQSPWTTPDVLAPVGGIVGTIITATSSVPALQYVLAACVAGACLVAMYYAVKRINQMDPA